MREYLKILARYLPDKKGLAITILITLLLQSAVFLSFQIAYKEIFDSITKHLPLFTIFAWIGFVLIASFTRIALLVFGDYTVGKLSVHIFNELRSKLYKHLQWLSVGYYQRTHMTAAVAGYTHDLQQSESATRQSLPLLISNFTTVVFALVLLFYFDFRLATLVFVLLTLTMGSTWFFFKPAKEITLRNQLSHAHLISLIDEAARQHVNVQAFNLQVSFYQKFKDLLAWYRSDFINGIVQGALIGRISILGLLLAEAAIFGTGAVMTYKGLMSTGTLFLFFTCVWNITGAFFTVAARFPDLVSAGVGMSRLQKLFEEKTEEPPEEHKGGKKISPLNEEIVMDRVSLTYDQIPVLNTIDLTIPAGSRFALMGATGSGKTTLLSLILGFYTPQEGEIRFDGKEIRDIDQSSLRDQIGVVFQHTPLFNLSLMENIRVGRLDASDEEVIKAAKDAEIHEFIKSLPEGYNTQVVEFGTNLSGGQKQRIALARVLLRNPSIFLLDEHTSALDPITETEVNAAILKKTQGKTVILATHRVACAAEADRICVLEKGKIVESGDHQALIEMKGRYYKMWQKQHLFSLEKREQTSALFLRDYFFKGCSDEVLREISEQFLVEWVDDETVVFEKGSYGDKFYLIVRGSVEIRNPDLMPGNTLVTVLEEGDFFGEVALLKNVPRTHQVVTRAHCIFLTLHASQFHALVAKDSSIRQLFDEALKNYSQ